jgi:hypothetical protein
VIATGINLAQALDSGGSRSVSWGGGGQMASAVARAYSGGLGARPQWGPVCNLLSSWGAMAPLAPPLNPPMVLSSHLYEPDCARKGSAILARFSVSPHFPAQLFIRNA